MSRVRTERDLVRFALVGAAVLVVVFMAALNWQRLPLLGGGGSSYTAEFADASGLVAGEDVRVAGVKVGKVTDIELGHGKVLVGFDVDDVAVGDRSTARIEIKTLLGQHYMSLVPKGRPLDGGAVIPLARTSTPVDIVPTLNQLGEDGTKLDTVKIAEAFESLSTVLDKTAPQLRPTLTSLTSISRAVNDRDDQIRELFANTRTVSGMVAARDGDLQSLLRSSSKVLTMLDDRKQVLDRLITGTELLARQVRGIVTDNQQLLAPTLRRLDAVLKVLRADRKQIDDIFDYGSEYARSFTSVGGSGRWFDASVAVPEGFALCAAPTQDDLGTLLSGLLSQMNKAVNKSGKPCLPLGPATGGEG